MYSSVYDKSIKPCYNHSIKSCRKGLIPCGFCIGAAPLILRRRDFLLSQAGAKERVDYA
nr:MAG TPA: hypothetical protein [Caudoviricetes sp.]